MSNSAMVCASIGRFGMANTEKASSHAGNVGDIFRDPSLMLALGTGLLLTGFLATAHACCIGLTTPHFAADLLQICSSAG